MYVYVCIFLIQHPPSYHHDSFMSSSALGLSTPMCGHKLWAFKNPKSAKLPLLHQATQIWKKNVGSRNTECSNPNKSVQVKYRRACCIKTNHVYYILPDLFNLKTFHQVLFTQESDKNSKYYCNDQLQTFKKLTD